jgi:K+ transporter
VHSGHVKSPSFESKLTIATLNKFPQGAWFPFMVAAIMTSFMAFWRWGMAKKRQYEWDNRVRLGQLLRRESEVSGKHAEGQIEGAFILGGEKPPLQTSEVSTSDPDQSVVPPSTKTSTSTDSMAIGPAQMSDSFDSTTGLRRRIQQLYLRSTGVPIARLPGISIYYTTAPTSHSHAPHTFSHFLSHFPALHSTCIFLHVRTAAQPHVRPEEKLMLEASPLWDGVWRGVYRVGYMETPDFTAAEFTNQIFEKLGRRVEGLTHVLQYTALKSREIEGQERKWYGKVGDWIRRWGIDVFWSGVDEVIGGVGKGWKVPVGEVVSVGSVAEV